jgi:flagellar motor switch protein FliN/FliY
MSEPLARMSDEVNARSPMKQAGEPLLRGGVPSEDSRTTPAGPSATAHVIEMTELAHPRIAEPDPTNGVHKPVSPLLSAFGDLHSPLRHIKTKLMVCVGTAEVTVGDLLAAKEQQVVRLDRTVEQPVDVLLEGQVVARGTLVAVDEYFAVRITELPLAVDASPNAPRKA